MDIATPAQDPGRDADLTHENDSGGQVAGASLQPLTAALLECVTPAEVVEAVVNCGMAVLEAEAVTG